MIIFVLTSLAAFAQRFYRPSLGVEDIMVGDHCKKKGTGINNLDSGHEGRRKVIKSMFSNL